MVRESEYTILVCETAEIVSRGLERTVVENQNRYSLSYRAAEAKKVMGWIHTGQCGCLVGLRGAGKSNFLRFLLRPDVHQHYLGRDHPNFSFVHVDLLSLVNHSSWAVYELILNEMVAQFDTLGMKGKSASAIAALHNEIMRRQDPLVAQRTVERYLNVLLNRPSQRLVILFDEFNAVVQTVDASLFRSLRALRDAHKERLIYIVAGTDDFARLRSDRADVEHFYRLVSRNVCSLGPYNEADARQMIDYLAGQRSHEFTPDDKAHLIELCGGHAGLLKAVLSLLSNTTRGLNIKKLTQTLNGESTIWAECQKIWQSLPESGQAALRVLVSDSPIKPDMLAHLEIKGLVRRSRPAVVFSPLFSEFVQRQLPSPTNGIFVDSATGKVHIEGRLVATLTGLELEELCYLYEHRGKVCTKDNIMENVYRQRFTNGIGDQMLQTLTARLRKKVEPDPKRPRYILTVRREGYKLVEPGEK